MKNYCKYLLAALFFISALSAAFACKKATALNAPENLRMEDEILYWDEVEDAEQYVVFIGDNAYYTRDAFFDTFEVFTVPGTYGISVVAQGDTENTYDSNPSEEFKYTLSTGGIMYRETDGGYEVVADPDKPPQGKLLIPAEINGKPVISIGVLKYEWGITMGGFENCTKLTSVILPESLNEINNNAFYGCTNLKRVKLPSGLTAIEVNLFAECASLWDCKIPDGVQSIEDGAFINCSALKNIKLPASVTKLGREWCVGTGLERLEVAEDNGVFYSEGNCIVTRADKMLVAGCANSKIPNGVKIIGNSAFKRMGLTEIQIPDSVTSIGNSAFESNKITRFELPKNVTEISPFALLGCGITSLSVQEGNPVYYGKGNCALKREGNEIVIGCETSVIPKEAESIGEYAFINCEGLTEIAIPSNIKEIKNYAFSCCVNLKNVLLSYGLEKIGRDVFEYCVSLSSLVIPETVTEVSANAFYRSIPTICVVFGRVISPAPSGWESGWNYGDNFSVLYNCVIGYDEEGYCYVISSAKLIPVGMDFNISCSGVIRTPYRTGYTFAGWATEEGGEVVYPVRTEKRVVTIEKENFKKEVEFTETVLYVGGKNRKEIEGITLYAVWLPQD